MERSSSQTRMLATSTSGGGDQHLRLIRRILDSRERTPGFETV
jgi:hypothetical protein